MFNHYLLTRFTLVLFYRDSSDPYHHTGNRKLLCCCNQVLYAPSCCNENKRALVQFENPQQFAYHPVLVTPILRDIIVVLFNLHCVLFTYGIKLDKGSFKCTASSVHLLPVTKLRSPALSNTSPASETKYIYDLSQSLALYPSLSNSLSVVIHSSFCTPSYEYCKKNT